MSAWSRRRARKADERRARAQDRLHGRAGISRTFSSRSRGEDLGELLVDILLAIPRALLWIVSKIFD